MLIFSHPKGEGHSDDKPSSNILMVIPSYHPIVGGAEQQLSLLAQSLMRNGQQTTVVTRKLRNLPPRETFRRIEIYRLPSKPYPIRFLFQLLWFLINKKHEYHLIHVHTLNSPFLLCAFWGRISGIPVLAKVTGTGCGSQIWKYQESPIRRWLFSIAVRHIAGFVATTKEVEATLRAAKVPDPKIFNIPNGVIIPAGHSETSGKIMRICSVGRLIPSKRTDWLIRCVADLRREGRLPNCEISIIGDGQERSRLERLAKESGLSDIILFRGMLGRDILEDVLREQDCFVLASEREGLSNSLLEAMANGMVAIAANIPANQALIETGLNGLLFDDLNDLKECVALVLSDSASARMLARNGKQTIVQNFSMELIVVRYIELYRSLIGLSNQTMNTETKKSMQP